MLSPAEIIHKIEVIRERFPLTDKERADFYQAVLTRILDSDADPKRLASAALGVPC